MELQEMWVQRESSQESNSIPVIDGVRVVDKEEGMEMLDEMAREQLNMSGEEFLKAWDEGRFGDRTDTPEVMRVAGLIPFAR
jgi:hypothetical protein